MDDFEEVDHPVDTIPTTLFQATPPLHQVSVYVVHSGPENFKNFKCPGQKNSSNEMNQFHGIFVVYIAVTKEASLCISTTSSHNNYYYDDDLDDLRGLEETTTAT